MSYGNIIVTVKRKISLVEVIVFTEATVVKTTEAAASVASNVATAMNAYLHYFVIYRSSQHLLYMVTNFRTLIFHKVMWQCV